MRSIRACGALAAVVLTGSVASAEGAPKAKQARFDVIVEGTGMAAQQVTGSGSNGVCDVSVSTSFSETYSYGRGKGVRMVFTRLGGGPNAPVLLTRSGRRLPAFNVRARFTDQANGTAERRDLGGGACPPVVETVGDEPQCGVVQRDALNLALGYANGELSVRAFDDQLPRLPGSGCGTNGVEPMTGAPLFGWPIFPELAPAALAPKRIFGKRAKFLVRLASGRKQQVLTPPIPAFTGQSLEIGEHDAIVRFIRVDD